MARNLASAQRPAELTPSQRLAEHLLGRPLVEYVAEKRNARPRWSWRMIAEQLSKDTGGQVQLSAEGLRVAYSDRIPAAVAS